MNKARVLSSTSTTTTSSFSMNAVDILILLICFAVLIITITIGSIYCKRRKEILIKQRNKKGIDSGKENKANEDSQVGKEKLEKRRISNLNADTESRKNSHATSKNSEASLNIINPISNISDSTADVNLNKDAIGNQSSKEFISKHTANSITSDSVVISVPRSDKKLLQSEDSTASYTKLIKKKDIKNSDFIEFENDIPIRSSKRRPTLMPTGKFVKKNTKESNEIGSVGYKDIVSFKVDTVKTLSESGSAKISIKENNESNKSKEMKKFVFKNFEHFEQENSKIESDSGEDSNINKHEEIKKQGESLMKMFLKYEDNILDPIVHKEKFEIPKEENIISRKPSELESQKTNDDIGFERSYKISKKVNSKNDRINKPIEENIMSDHKDDLISFKNKYLFKKENNKINLIKNYFREDSSIPKQI